MQSPNDVIQKVEKTLNNVHTTPPHHFLSHNRIPCRDPGFPWSGQIPYSVNKFCVFPNPTLYSSQFPDPEKTLPDPEENTTWLLNCVPAKCHLKITKVILFVYYFFVLFCQDLYSPSKSADASQSPKCLLGRFARYCGTRWRRKLFFVWNSFK